LQAVFLSLILISTLFFAQDNMMKDKKIGDEKMSDEKMSDEMMHDDMKIDKDENDVAIKGYDQVAYFTVGKPVMGKSQFSYKWNDAEWHFVSEKHLSLFKESPGKYAPQ